MKGNSLSKGPQGRSAIPGINISTEHPRGSSRPPELVALEPYLQAASSIGGTTQIDLPPELVHVLRREAEEGDVDAWVGDNQSEDPWDQEPGVTPSGVSIEDALATIREHLQSPQADGIRPPGPDTV
ncbi:hypothetical protein HN748_05350 [Candidatus Peregrinibacteria bacterium]|jgi:hypothetical protein|nr:hypothetical protein [Candidatus Peregrinibacteria bacterium]MBT7703634.1 hypothetical protein [Candidatus Peregrinibacteria bacterium]